MSLELSLLVVFVVEDDALVGYGYEDFFSGMVGEVMNSIEDVVVEAKRPFEFECASLGKVFLLIVVLIFLH